jgi:hypothetical protein
LELGIWVLFDIGFFGAWNFNIQKIQLYVSSSDPVD